MTRWIVAIASVCALTVAAGQHTLAARSYSTNYLTFNATMALPGVTLAPGTYTFEIANPAGSPRVVAVSSRDGRHRYFMAHTRPVSRPASMDLNKPVTLGEAPAGAPTPILAWYPIGTRLGFEFVY